MYCTFGRQQLRQWDVDEVRVAVCAGAIGEAELHRFRQQVGVGGRVVSERAQIVAGQDIQGGDQDSATGAWRRHAVHLVTVKSTSYRAAPDGTVRSKVGVRQNTPGCPHGADDLVGDPAMVERRRTKSPDFLEGSRKIGSAQNVANLQGGSVRPQEQRGEVRTSANLFLLPPDRLRQVCLDGKAIARVADGRRGYLGEGETSESIEGGRQAGDLTGRCNGQPSVQAGLRIGLPLAQEHVARRRGRSGLAEVERRHRLRPALEDQHEATSADPAGGRVDDAAGERSGNRGVDEISAALENVDSGLRGEAVFGGDHRFRLLPVRPRGEPDEKDRGDEDAAQHSEACIRVAPVAQIGANLLLAAVSLWYGPDVAMATQAARASPSEFAEKSFYLEEFRGHTISLAVSLQGCESDGGLDGLAEVLRELVVNGTRVILLIGVPGPGHISAHLGRVQRRLQRLVISEETSKWFPSVRGRRSLKDSMLDLGGAGWREELDERLIQVWTTLRSRPLLVALVETDALTEAAARVAGKLRVHKLVIAEPAGGVSSASAGPMSFLDETMLTMILHAGQAEWAGVAERRATLTAIRSALQQGVSTVNLCSLAGISHELYTYEGSGTLFTREDYCHVERLGIDDFEQVERLILRGQREGFLKPRDGAEITRILLNGFGATIGTRHLAGVCGLETGPYRPERAGEIVGLYTITRFKTEGVGQRLMDRVLLEAASLGLRYVFACTMHERAEAFFERQGFRAVKRSDVPVSKWADYDRNRIGRLRVLRKDIETVAGQE